MKLSNKVYDIIKWFVTIVLPASAAFYTGLSKIWGFPYATEVAGTISAITVFVGAVMQYSSHQYKKELTEKSVSHE